jgi:hypothetical protein
LEEAIVPDRFWAFAGFSVEPTAPTNPNAILSAIAAAPIRLVVMMSSRHGVVAECVLAHLTSPHLTEGSLNTHKRRSVDDRAAQPQRGVAEALTGCPAVVGIVAIGAASSGAPELRSITAPPVDTISIYLHIIAHATEAREPRTSGGCHLLGGGRIEAPGHS